MSTTFNSVFVSCPAMIDNIPTQLVLRDRKYVELSLVGEDEPVLYAVCPRAVVRYVKDTAGVSFPMWDEWTHAWELSPNQAGPEWEILFYHVDQWKDASFLSLLTMTGRFHSFPVPRRSACWEDDLKFWLRGCADQNEESDRALARQDSIVKDILGTITQ